MEILFTRRNLDSVGAVPATGRLAMVDHFLLLL
jgi:hypothetical protein